MENLQDIITCCIVFSKVPDKDLKMFESGDMLPSVVAERNPDAVSVKGLLLAIRVNREMEGMT